MNIGHAIGATRRGVDASSPALDWRSSPLARGVEFDSILKSRREETSAEERARSAAENFVAQSLVLPVLKSLREQNQAAPPFAPGDYEKNIGSLFDMHLADEIVGASNFPIVDAVARNLLSTSGADVASDQAEQGGSRHEQVNHQTSNLG